MPGDCDGASYSRMCNCVFVSMRFGKKRRRATCFVIAMGHCHTELGTPQRKQLANPLRTYRRNGQDIADNGKGKKGRRNDHSFLRWINLYNVRE